MEQWKQIRNAPSGYFVSDLGRIKIIKNDSETIKIGHKNKDGYLLVGINYQQLYVHRLVADYWCGGPDDYECVNHLNGIKTDNRAVNLEKTTYKRNNHHAIQTGLNRMSGEYHPNVTIPIEKIHDIYRLKKEGKKLYQIKGLFDIDYGTLKCIYSGKNWKYEYKKFFDSFPKPGRSGSNQWLALPEWQVLKIYSMKKEGVKIFEIANQMSLKYGTVSCIFRGITWKHLYKEHFEL